MRRGLAAALLLLASGPAWASGFGDYNPKEGRFLDLDVGAGLPGLISGEVRVVALSHFELGLGFGSAPINGLAQKVAPLGAVALNSTYSLDPSASYSLSGVYGFARWFPWGTGWFLGLGLYFDLFSASVTAPLVNTSSGASVADAVNSSVTLSQLMVEIGPGYEVFFGDHFHLDLSAGLIVLLAPSSSVSVGGELADLSALDSGAQAAYSSAKASLANQVAEGMATYENSVQFLPAATISMGYVF